jgi:hypothetical protein
MPPPTIEPAEQPRDYSGMSIRDHFAARAPLEIPEWFVHVPPPKNFPDQPKVDDAPKKHQQQLRDWIHDGTYDLSAELAYFQVAWNAHIKARDEWKERDEAARYIQWRWHYADLMLAAR